jgi:hypothetical protein
MNDSQSSAIISKLSIPPINKFSPLKVETSLASHPTNDTSLANTTNDAGGMTLRSKRVVPSPDRISPSKKRRLRRKRHFSNLAKANQKANAETISPPSPKSNNHYVSPPPSAINAIAKQLSDHLGINTASKTEQAITNLSERATNVAIQSALDLLDPYSEKPAGEANQSFNASGKENEYFGEKQRYWKRNTSNIN